RRGGDVERRPIGPVISGAVDPEVHDEHFDRWNDEASRRLWCRLVGRCRWRRARRRVTRRAAARHRADQEQDWHYTGHTTVAARRWLAHDSLVCSYRAMGLGVVMASGGGERSRRFLEGYRFSSVGTTGAPGRT